MCLVASLVLFDAWLFNSIVDVELMMFSFIFLDNDKTKLVGGIVYLYCHISYSTVILSISLPLVDIFVCNILWFSILPKSFVQTIISICLALWFVLKAFSNREDHCDSVKHRNTVLMHSSCTRLFATRRWLLSTYQPWAMVDWVTILDVAVVHTVCVIIFGWMPIVLTFCSHVSKNH